MKPVNNGKFDVNIYIACQKCLGRQKADKTNGHAYSIIFANWANVQMYSSFCLFKHPFFRRIVGWWISFSLAYESHMVFGAWWIITQVLILFQIWFLFQSPRVEKNPEMKYLAYYQCIRRYANGICGRNYEAEIIRPGQGRECPDCGKINYPIRWTTFRKCMPIQLRKYELYCITKFFFIYFLFQKLMPS